MTLYEVINGALKNSSREFKVMEGKNNSTKFVVKCNSLKLQGIVTNESYVWKLKKFDNTTVDESKCSIKNTDELLNRLTESINTGVKLSEYVTDCAKARQKFFNSNIIKEVEDKDEKESEKQLLLSDEDEIVRDDDTATDFVDVPTALDNVIQKSVDLANEITGIMDMIDDSDLETKNELIGLAGNFYSIADDIDDVIDELYPEDEEDEVNESVTKKSIGLNKQIINKLAEASMLMRNKPEYNQIRESLKLIKSELILKK
jgi:hypothetical protein